MKRAFSSCVLLMAMQQLCRASLSICTTGSSQGDYFALTQPWLLPWQRRMKTVGATDTNVCVITDSRNAKCLGMEGYERTSVPASVNTDLLTISLGNWHSCSINIAGILSCWLTHGFGRRVLSLPTGLGTLRWATVSVGGQRVCAVTVNGEGHCWGYPAWSSFSLPASLLSACWAFIAVGPVHACGIDCRGQLQCWGANDGGQSTPPLVHTEDAYWLDVAVGKHHTCGVISNGTAVCFGHNQFQQASAPFSAQGWEAIACGDSQTCAIDGSGAIFCWGGAGNDRAFITPPASTIGWIGISCQGITCCAVDRFGKLECWGRAHVQFPVTEPRAWPIMTRGSGYTCAVSFYGSGDCWITGTTATANMPGLLRERVFKELAPGKTHVCGLRIADSGVSCTSSGFELSGSYTRLASGAYYTCGLTTAFALECSGTTSPVFSLANGETLIDIVAWESMLCGTTSHGKLVCTDFSTSFSIDPPPGELFVSADVGNGVACVLTMMSTMHCWDVSEFAAPSIVYTPKLTGDVWAAVGAGSIDNMCGLTSSGYIRCFGGNGGRNDPNPLFQTPAIALVGGSYPCGMSQDGETICWTYSGTMEVSNRKLNTGGLSVAVGDGFVCTLHYDGLATCIGDIEAPPSTVTFDNMCAGPNYACGISTTKKMHCWGDTAGLQLPSQYDNFIHVACGQGTLCAIQYSYYGGANDIWCTGTLNPSSTQLNDQCLISSGPFGANNVADTYTDITVGANYVCAVRRCGPAVCWGTDAPAPQPDEEWTSGSFFLNPTLYESVDTAPLSQAVCGILVDNGVPYMACWGERTVTMTYDPSKPILPEVLAYKIRTKYSKVKAYNYNAYCGFVDGSIQCGALHKAPEIEKEYTLPAGAYIAFDVAAFDADLEDPSLCALDSKAQMTCWSPSITIPQPFVAATGCIPKELPHLFLPFSNVKSSLPPTLSRLSALSVLQLHRNGLTGEYLWVYCTRFVAKNRHESPRATQQARLEVRSLPWHWQDWFFLTSALMTWRVG